MLYKLAFYVPVAHCEQVKQALFAAGAGKFRHYDLCSWQTLGLGQFRPLPGSKPYQGRTGQLETVAEYKVEMICTDDVIKPVVRTLLNVHPYQQPAYEVYPILGVEEILS
ncbi:MAG: NGG1p interacting factor NIF3 [Methylomonas sp.]|jgi:hypothetical protein